jgi:hypothetical protein
VVTGALPHRRFDGPAELGALVPVGDTEPVDHTQVAFGVEYGWTWPGGGDATLVLEGQTIPGLGLEERASLHPFQRDLLLGYRHSSNDVWGRELTAGVVVDLDRWPEGTASASFRQRLSDVWSVEALARAFHAPEEETPGLLAPFDGVRYVELVLVRHF